MPRARGCGVPASFAERAENINLGSGRFEPWHEPLQLVAFDERIRTAHVRNNCWTGTHHGDAVYVDTGVARKTYLSVPDQNILVTDDVCNPDWTFLGYPVPANPYVVPDTNAPVDKGPDTELRSYIITYGNGCEEGPASCPTEAIMLNKDSRVGLAIPRPPKDYDCWGITKVNVYRTQALWDIEQGLFSFDLNPRNASPIEAGFTSSNLSQEYFKIAELDISNTFFVDQGVDELGSKLVVDSLLPPPKGATLVGMTDQGSNVVYWDNSIAFSERNKLWGFPLRTYHDFPDCVLDVKICANTLLVLTTGGAYLVDDNVDCSDSTIRPVQRLKGAPTPYPCLACTEIDNGFLYASQEGLVRVTIEGQVSNAGASSFDKDTWRELGLIKELHTGCGLLFMSTEDKEYIWQLGFTEEGQLPPDLSTLSFVVDQWITDENGHVYFLINDSVYQFDGGCDYMDMDWLQAEQRLDSTLRISALGAEYVCKDTTNYNKVSVFRDGKLSTQNFLKGKGKKIRSTATSCYQLRVQGNEPMCHVAYGQGLSDLRNRGDQ